MIFHNIQDSPYTFLKKAAAKLSKNYSLGSIYMDERGKLCLTFRGILKKDNIQFIMNIITPKEYGFDDYTVTSSDYCYNNDKLETYVYSADGIDYRNLA